MNDGPSQSHKARRFAHPPKLPAKKKNKRFVGPKLVLAVSQNQLQLLNLFPRFSIKFLSMGLVPTITTKSAH